MNEVQVLHIEKRVKISSGLNRHITRQQFVSVGNKRRVEVWVPDNADPSRTGGNVELVSRMRVGSKGRKVELTLQQAVDERIKEAGVKPRKGQSTCLEMIFSGSRDVMTAMSREDLLSWAQDTLAWAQDTWGKDNVVSASLHVDELTPHIHMIVVPIVTGESRRTRLHKQQNKSSKTYNIDHDRLRLCVNEVYTQGKLYEYHDGYAEKVSLKYGLSRGVKAEPGSKKKHTTSIEYNRLLAAQAAEQKALIEELRSDYSAKEQKLSVLENSVVMADLALVNAKKKTVALQAEFQSSKATQRQEMLDLSAKTNALKAEVVQRTKQLKLTADLETVPKKGLLGYKTEEVDSFIQRVKSANLIAEINNTLPDFTNVNSVYYAEVKRLKEVEKKYNELLNSPEALQKKLNELKSQEKQLAVKGAIELVLGKQVSALESVTVEQTPHGEEMFARFRLSKNSPICSVVITPKLNFSWTEDPRVLTLEIAKELCKEKIWHNAGNIAEIRQQREQEVSNGQGRRR